MVKPSNANKLRKDNNCDTHARAHINKQKISNMRAHCTIYNYQLQLCTLGNTVESL